MTGIKSVLNRIEPSRFLYKKANQFILDLIIFILSFFFSYIVRFEGIPQGSYLKQLLIIFPYIALVRILSFSFFSIYSIVWRYVSIMDALSILKATLPVSLILLLGRTVLPAKISLLRLSFSVIALEFMFVLTGTLGIRMTRRLHSEMSEREFLGNNKNSKRKKRVLLVGAGNAGNMVIKELKQRTDLGFYVVGFVDDDPKKFKSVIQGVKVLGHTTQIPEFVQKLKIEEIIISIANATSKEIRRIVEIGERSKVKVKIIPGLFELLDDKVKITKIRELDINDLLGRSLVSFESNLPEVVSHYKNKKILVTGAGGSIGSELCRQLAAVWPKEIILLDKDENSIFEIDNELSGKLRGSAPGIVHPLIANIKNRERLNSLFERYQPEVVFHAAAHKHVPLMERNVSEAVLNNIEGTLNVVELSDQFGVEKVIFISTDKAVNPTSIMGATKKMGEVIVQDMAPRSRTKFSCVRFGNVLGSRGSVVPLFQKQIAAGGPITITHPDIKRYFMSISEAVQLIIQAGTIGEKGEIFILDMGKQVRIVDLAKEMIRLSGHGENDIEIKFVGLRPGEKLFEEILIDEETAQATKFEKIFFSPPPESGSGQLMSMIDELISAAHRNDELKIVQSLAQMGIGYRGKNALQG